MLQLGSPQPYFVVAGVAFVLLIGFFVWMRRREQRIMAAREKKVLKDSLAPGWPAWGWIVGFALGMTIIAGVVTGTVAGATQDLRTPQTITAQVDVPTTVAENGQRFVQLRYHGSGYKMTYVCQPEECVGLAADDQVAYTSYWDDAARQYVVKDLHKI